MLIIAPLRPTYVVWPFEIEKWENFKDLTYVVLHGPNKEAALRTDADIYIINPEGLQWLYDERFNRFDVHQFDVLCIDESTKFKDSSTRRFKTLKSHLHKFNRRWILTGTPSPNGIGDLFGQIYILDDGRALGRYITHFRNNYFYRPGYSIYEWKIRPGAFDQIVERVAPLVFQLKAEDYLKMPRWVNVEVPVYLPDNVMEQYKTVEDEFLLELEGNTIVAANAAVAGGKCRQIANGAIYINGEDYVEVHDKKLEALEDLLEELGGQPTLLLYEFNHDKERILARLGDVPCLSSGISGRKLESLVHRFNAGEIPVLLGHPGSMGHGLNLQASCAHVILYGITWNLEYYDQAIRRVYRQGQKAEAVMVYHIIAKGTADERVVKVLKDKDTTQRELLTALKSARHGIIGAPAPLECYGEN